MRSPHLPLRLLQRSLDALFWTRALGGCRTTRDTAAAIATSGFELVSLERGFSERGYPPLATQVGVG